MQVIASKSVRELLGAVLSMLLASACMKPDASTDPGTQSELNNQTSVTVTPQSRIGGLNVASDVSTTLAPYLSARALKLERFRQESRELFSEMLADARGDQLLTSKGHSRADECLASLRLAEKYGNRFSVIAKRMDVDLGPQFIGETVRTSPQCRSNNGMSVFALHPAMVGGRSIAVARLSSVDEIDDAVEALLNDSLTDAGYNRLSTIDLSSANDISEVDALLNSVSAHGLGTIDRAIFNAGREELRNQYVIAFAIDWENLPAPYLIFDPYYGWRRPTAGELWEFLGGGCITGLSSGRTAIRSAAFAGARAGFIAGSTGGPGAAALSGALAGAAAGGAAAAVACGGGAGLGGIILIGRLHLQ